MADRGLERLFDTLSATFDAAIAREEEIAAADLAITLRQDGSMREELLRRAGALFVEGWGSPRISEVGLDYVGAGRPVEVLVPSAAALVRRTEAYEMPTASERSLVEELRRWARSGRRVEIRTWHGELDGRLVAVGRDYVVVKSAAGEAAVGLNAVAAVRSVRGGSGDAP
jgi:hypothetical protein